ncbi:hypothetical protein CLAFUW4_04106 [Fulvia fulva]|uniref:Uncharacterized protein n=1 Tax=Passalora fulva TaxID=5499 RepID=A0A9Q8P7K7_PASFU|nr:uncharacterized protein CLAFUR5_04068 [Fulvia fulva]KAK4627344.1 hypothetical protein CLAFUR4_04092 [Fulvia fulva]KAK4627814.1 hypothetical protein CLAFUR0_04093 [Fulvia fulva]UJO15992.1 hypothetical protein CLAFUR5_04068 [Fulvia fulva]WPV13130.1 hypothetical protein CLAFUW4_04106 [Fulvia fulva]WPV28763.1 hypothetical protein CLAFUW7_04095 [Fulvia fulva]
MHLVHTCIGSSLRLQGIYHSGDGGMYGELIQNRAFQGTQNGNGAYGTPSLTPTTRYLSPLGSEIEQRIATRRM